MVPVSNSALLFVDADNEMYLGGLLCTYETRRWVRAFGNKGATVDHIVRRYKVTRSIRSPFSACPCRAPWEPQIHMVASTRWSASMAANNIQMLTVVLG